LRGGPDPLAGSASADQFQFQIVGHPFFHTIEKSAGNSFLIFRRIETEIGFRIIAIKFFRNLMDAIDFIGPGESLLFDIVFPPSQLGHALGCKEKALSFAQRFFAGPQGLLSLFALGDIAANAENLFVAIDIGGIGADLHVNNGAISAAMPSTWPKKYHNCVSLKMTTKK